jgi:hypothetical protein
MDSILLSGPIEPARKRGLLGSFCGDAVGDFAADAGAFIVDVPHRLGVELVVILRDGGGGEGVRFRDVGTGFEVHCVKLRHEIGPREAQDVVIALHLAGMRGEAIAAIVGFGEAHLLEHDAP